VTIPLDVYENCKIKQVLNELISVSTLPSSAVRCAISQYAVSGGKATIPLNYSTIPSRVDPWAEEIAAENCVRGAENRRCTRHR
jgi:hypothetical protein